MNSDQLVAHVDISSYFATLMQQENPFLRNKPVGVVKEAGRTCIIAASKEAKRFGIKAGTNVAEAKTKAPNIVLVPAAFELYLYATRTLKIIFESFSPDIEIYSLDEAFLHLSACRRLYPDLEQFGKRIQQEIKNKLGEWVTCNVGMSYNRFLAKLASEVSPKGSVTVITEENKDAYLLDTPFESVCGIGFRLQRKLEMMGVTTPYLIHFCSDEELERQVEPYWIHELRKMAHGEEPALLERSGVQLEHMKSVGRSITGYRLCNDEEVIQQILYNLTLEVIHKTRKMGLAGRQISIALFGEDQYWSTHVTKKYYICHSKEMFSILYHELYRSWPRSFKIIKFAVRLSLLEVIENIPLPLFPAWWKEEKVSLAVDRVNEKYGLYTIHPARINGKTLIYPEVTGFLGDKAFYLGRA